MKRQPFYVQTRHEVIRVCTTCGKVAVQLAEIIMGSRHGPFEITTREEYDKEKHYN